MVNPKAILAISIATLTIIGLSGAAAAPVATMSASDDATAASSVSSASDFATAGDGPPEDPECDNPGNGEPPHCNDEEDEEDDEDDEDEGEVGTCEEGGAAQENTVANEVFDTENEEGPISEQIHENEEQFQDGEPVAHEVSCVVATVDNNAPDDDDDDGNESDPADQLEELLEELQENAPGDDDGNPVEDVIGEIEDAGDDSTVALVG